MSKRTAAVKPRLETRRLLYDQFADWSIADQARAIEVLTEIHRQAQRKGAPAATATAQPSLEGVANAE